MCEARGNEQPGEILIGAEFLYSFSYNATVW